tara:strand:- start:190970 stop:191824 length:855 start_codon:yes stop_codon:yes gene_type:complete
MDFLAMIIALGLVQVWGSAQRLHHDGWFEDWCQRVRSWQLPEWAGLSLIVLLPTLLAVLVLDAARPILFGLLWIALAAALLLYSLGRNDFNALLERYRSQCREGDFEGAFLAAQQQSGWVAADSQPDTATQAHQLVQQGVLYDGYQRWFAVLFYFFLLGPAGALAYRLLQLSSDPDEPTLSDRVLFYSDWVPVRLVAAAFSLTGDFVRSRDALLSSLSDVSESAAGVLFAVGSRALGAPAVVVVEDEDASALGERAAQENTEFAALLRRSAFAWLAALSLLELL